MTAAWAVCPSCSTSLPNVPGAESFTPREREIATRLINGARPQQIAAALFLAPPTVRNHLSSMFRKVGVSRQADFIALFRPEVTA